VHGTVGAAVVVDVLRVAAGWAAAVLLSPLRCLDWDREPERDRILVMLLLVSESHVSGAGGNDSTKQQAYSC
jgi:hypothetical protein